MTNGHQVTLIFKKLSTQIVIFLIISINSIFSYKYISRYSNYALIITISYAVLLFFLSNYLLSGKGNRFAKYLLYLIGCYIILMIIVFSVTDPSKIRVDRWSVIIAFWDAVRNGIFPYQVKSHLGCYPVTFPAFFIMALPFYLIGEIGYFSLSGLILMLYNIKYYFRDKLNNKITSTFLLLSSIAILWELTVRSTVLVNSALVALYIILLLNNKEYNFLKIAAYGFLGGLILSTRGIFILPFISTITYYFIKPLKIKELIIYMVSLVIAFVITLIPLILWDSTLFIKYNPITLQTGFIGLNIAIILAFISLLLGFIVKNEPQLFLGIGITIYMTAVIYFFEKLLIYNISTNFIQNQVDISYFILAIPFLLLSI